MLQPFIAFGKPQPFRYTPERVDSRKPEGEKL